MNPKQEPAVAWGVVGSILIVVGTWLTKNPDFSVAALVPLVSGIVTRFFVSPRGHSGERRRGPRGAAPGV